MAFANQLRETLKDDLQVYNWFKEPTNLRGMWAGRSAFLVCGGPSLNQHDPATFTERGVASLGINNAAGHVKTTAMTCSDPPQKFSASVWFDPTILKFVPLAKYGHRRGRIHVKHEGKFFRSSWACRDCPSTFFYDRRQCFQPEDFLTGACVWGTNSKGVQQTGRPKLMCSMLLGIRLLHYLGCPEIFLVGVDFGMTPTQKYAFAQDRTADAIKSNQDLYSVAAAELAAIKPTLDAAGFDIYNTNARSHLTVFPHVPFDDALERIRGGVEKVPDLSEFYEKSKPVNA